MKRAQGSRAVRALAALAIAVLAFGLRWRALEALPIDYDETWYLEAAQELAAVLRSGELSGLLEANWRPEHPQLGKLVFAAALLPASDPAPSPERRYVAGGRSRLPEGELVAARTASAVLGALAVGLLAWIQPLAGLFLAIHTTTIKYTSLVMLEALPAFASLAAVACWVRAKPEGRSGWRLASAACLGLAAAGKYMYAVVGIALLVDAWLDARSSRASLAARARPLLLWGTGALAVFFAASPYLWPDPLWRLRESLLFHADFAASAGVASLGFPFWQPLVWLGTSLPGDAPAAHAYVLRLDPWIALLALVGLDRLWRRHRAFALWLGVALVFLLLWTTKWPHYVLLLTAPLCLAAAEGGLRLAGSCVSGLRSMRAAARPS